MIDFYFWTTPNGYKVLMFLEETGIPYRIIPINISKGEQFDPEFLKISPNNKMPAIIDHDPAAGEGPISIFESGAIFLFLAEKTGKFLPQNLKGRNDVLQWLFWQVGGVGLRQIAAIIIGSCILRLCENSYPMGQCSTLLATFYLTSREYPSREVVGTKFELVLPLSLLILAFHTACTQRRH